MNFSACSKLLELCSAMDNIHQPCLCATWSKAFQLLSMVNGKVFHPTSLEKRFSIDREQNLQINYCVHDRRSSDPRKSL